MDHMPFANYENEIQGDDSKDDLGNEDEELVQDQLLEMRKEMEEVHQRKKKAEQEAIQKDFDS
ncbi:hypothetical protein Hdeb2414_s0069g00770991 [Helianthus debilis subsp. tardiflorus]